MRPAAKPARHQATAANSSGSTSVRASPRAGPFLVDSAVSQGVMTAMNKLKGWTPVRELVGDIIGRTAGNMGVYDLIKLVRTDVQQDRQHYRENLPTVIASKFTRKLTDQEWSALFRGLGKTDLAALSGHFSVKEVLEMLGDESGQNGNRRPNVARPSPAVSA